MKTYADAKTTSIAVRMLTLVYGTVSYLIFLVAALYSIGFVGNLIVPQTIDAGPAASFIHALIVDALLLALFAIQHSVMAPRPSNSGGQRSFHNPSNAARMCC